MKAKSLRMRLLVDASLQSGLLSRVVLYWLLCLIVMLALAGLQAAWSSREVSLTVLFNRSLLAFGPALLASFVLLPVVLFDALRFSHRFAGPVHRLIRESRRLADGETVQPVVFRKGDYWGELATEFNRVSDEMHRLRRAEAAATASDRETTVNA